MIVSTPQEIALIDARKGVGLFKKLSIPVRPAVVPSDWLDSRCLSIVTLTLCFIF